MKKKEGSRRETTHKSQQFDKNKIISYTKLVGLGTLLVVVTHSGMKLIYQPPFSLMLLVTVAEKKNRAVALKATEQEHMSIMLTFNWPKEIARPHLTSRKKEIEFYYVARRRFGNIWRTDGLINDFRISDLNNVGSIFN